MKKLAAAILTLTALAVMTGSTGAITYGEPDADEHPYVGFIIYFLPEEPGWFSCSGTLMDEDTFLTAGHCTFGVGVDGAGILTVPAAPTCGSASTPTTYWPVAGTRRTTTRRRRCTRPGVRG